MTEPEQEENIVFNVEKVYIKDISYEAPGVPHAFNQESAPQVNVRLNIKHSVLNEEQGLYEVELTVTVHAKSEEKNIFLVEVKQAGVFRISGLTPERLPMALSISCPNVLLPFAREVINDLVSKGGFPQLLLAPVNFEAMYEQREAAQKKEVQH